MKYYRIIDLNGDVHLSVETGNGILENITSVENDVVNILDLAKSASYSGDTMDNLTRLILESGNPRKNTSCRGGIIFSRYREL